MIAALVAGGADGWAQRLENRSLGRDVLMMADDIRYDESTQTVSATGRVELSVDARVLLADRLSYNQRTEVIEAVGNVSILEADGTVLFADRIELRDQLRNGSIAQFKALLSDNSRLTAAGAQRDDGNRTRMFNALYSPCDLCPSDPSWPPLWAVRASRVVHDQEAKEVTYAHARLEIYGVPVAYTPYFSHPDPSVQRKTGFLTPTQGHSTQFGTKIETPFYVNLAPNADATFSPLFTSKEGIVYNGEFRQRTRTGNYDLTGSFTQPDLRDNNNARVIGSKDDRGHIRGRGRFVLDDTWRWGFAVARASDDTYLKKFGLGGDDVLRSNLYVNGSRGRSFAAANAYSFQGLRASDDPGQTPYVLPLLEYGYVSDAGRFGDTLRFDANFLALNRNSGADASRFSVRTGWQVPYYGSLGDVTTVKAELRADGYHVDDSRLNPRPTGSVATGASEDGFAGRAIPQVSLDWRLPFVRTDQGARQMVTPVVDLIASPYGGNTGGIPNEDSQSFEFDDTNVFSTNRFPGFDRVEGGPRANVGMKYGIYSFDGYSMTALLGQTFHGHADDTFAAKTGLENIRSDYVARINISPASYLQYYERFRFDRDTLGLRRHEIGVDAGP
ncbi:MAG: LPS-assembly protein LptD, partial [Alphaproteobacteria bacterium]|nr:LPS-assembly protein LptD [Alphaproteobacteria bacterium]